MLSADAFSAFEEAGLEDEAAVADTGRRFRDTVSSHNHFKYFPSLPQLAALRTLHVILHALLLFKTPPSCLANQLTT